MKSIIINIGIIILKIIYLPLKCLKIKNQIVYISRQFNHANLDFKLLINEIERINPKYKNVVLAKRMEKGILNNIKYMLHMLKQMYYIATSKIVILDSYCIVASVLKHKKDKKIIQMWHALGAIKKFGYQTIGKQSGADSKIAELMCMHKNYDVVLAPSKITQKCYEEAFNIGPEKIKLIGLPRIDFVLTKKDTSKIYTKYPELQEKPNVLYVPTFRKGKKIRLHKLIQEFDTEKYNLVIKLHPLDQKEYEYIQKPGVIFDNIFNSYELFDIADKIITDYSSLAIEASLLNKPIYFYTYDLKEYEQDPGLNFNYFKEPVGKYMAKTPKKLLRLLDEEYDYTILEKFKNKYITVNTNNCTNQLSKYILELAENEYKEKVEEKYYTDSKEKLNI